MTEPGGVSPHRFSAGRFSTGLLGAAALIAVITVVARLVGFARIVVFARTIGPATCLGNAYFTANTVPNIVFEIVAGGALASLVVPVLAGPVARGDDTVISRTASALLTWTVLILTPISVAGIWLVHPVMRMLVGDSGQCDPNQVVDVGARMLLVFLPQIVLYGVGIVLTGVLQAHRRFAGPALAPLLSSLVVITTYVVFADLFSGDPNHLGGLGRSDELVLSIGTTLGVVVLSLSLAVPLFRTNVRLRPTLHFPDGIAKRVRILAIAGVATLVAQELAVAVVLRLANDAGPRGAVTVYNLAWTVFLLPWAVLAVPLATSAFPRLSAAAAEVDDETFAEVSRRSTRAVLLVTLGAAAALVAAAEPIAAVLARHGPGSDAADVHSLARAIAAFAPGVVGYGLVASVGRALYAHGRAAVAAGATVAGWLAVVGADVGFVVAANRSDTVPALALGNTVGMTLAGVLLVVGLMRTAGRGLSGVSRTALVAVCAASAAAVVGRLVQRHLQSGGVGANIGVGILVATASVIAFTAVVAALDRAALTELRERGRVGV